jgi:serine/threonine-protein kinase
VKLLDFGLATASSNATIVDVLASPGYMSPEQIAGTAIDVRTDIFSAGVVLYELFSGRQPFEADSPTGVMMKIVNDPASPMAGSELPPALKAAVARAIEKSPSARYARASDFARDLKAVKANLPIPRDAARDTATVMIDRKTLRLPQPEHRAESQAPSRSPEPRPPAAQPVRSRTALMIAAAVVLVLAASGIGWCAYRGTAALRPSAAPPVAAVNARGLSN